MFCWVFHLFPSSFRSLSLILATFILLYHKKSFYLSSRKPRFFIEKRGSYIPLLAIAYIALSCLEDDFNFLFLVGSGSLEDMMMFPSPLHTLHFINPNFLPAPWHCGQTYRIGINCTFLLSNLYLRLESACG